MLTLAAGVFFAIAGVIWLIVLLTQGVDLVNKAGVKQGGGYQLIVYAIGLSVFGVALVAVGIRGVSDREAPPADVASKTPAA
jgi:hypothetical protein